MAELKEQIINTSELDGLYDKIRIHATAFDTFIEQSVTIEKEGYEALLGCHKDGLHEAVSDIGDFALEIDEKLDFIKKELASAAKKTEEAIFNMVSIKSFCTMLDTYTQEKQSNDIQSLYGSHMLVEAQAKQGFDNALEAYEKLTRIIEKDDSTDKLKEIIDLYTNGEISGSEFTTLWRQINPKIRNPTQKERIKITKDLYKHVER